VKKENGIFVCAHVRVADAYFALDKEKTLVTLAESVLAVKLNYTSPPNARPGLLVIADVPLDSILPSLQAVTTRFDVFGIESRFGDLVSSTQAEIGEPVSLMHFEAAACVNGKEFFGHNLSTFSRRILALRKKQATLP